MVASLLSLILCCIVCTVSAAEWGIRADQISLNSQAISEAPHSKDGKFLLTYNQKGFDILEVESNWVLEAFLAALEKGMVVLDGGAGYGALSRAALQKGAIVISNDLSLEQLLYSLKHLTVEQKKRLYLNHNNLQMLNFAPKTFDAVMLHRVLHFMKGAEIEALLHSIHTWLKPGGKLYIVMMSKNYPAFKDKIQYDVSKEWPGEDLVISKIHLPDQAYALPQTLHVMAVDTLQKALERNGFILEKAQDLEAVGVVAIKK